MPGAQEAEHLVPRMRDLPISNARYTQRAVITEVVPPGSDEPNWNPYTTEGRHDARGIAVTSSADGRLMATAASDGTLVVHRIGAIATSPTEVLRLAWDDTAWVHLAFDPTGSSLAIMDDAGLVMQVDVATGTHTGVFAGPAHAGMGLTHTAAGEVVAAFGDGAIEVRAGSDERVLAALPDLGIRQGRICLQGDGGCVVVTGHDSVTTLWDIATQDATTLFHTGPINALALSADGSRLVLGRPFEAHVWDLTTTEHIGVVSPPGDGEVSDVALRADGAQLVVAKGGMMSVCATDATRVLRSTSEHTSMGVVDITPDGTLLTVDSTGQVVVVYDMDAGITSPLLLPDPATADDAARPAIGVLLTHEQAWTMEGIALGELLHTVSLAPGEVTQVAVSSHSHSVVQGSADTATQRESLDQSGASASSLTDHEAASASESQAGMSAGMSASVSAEAGVSFLGVSAGSSSHAATGMHASYSTGTRNVADESAQDVHQASTERARMDRSRHTASVREVSEHDSVELRTRVVANYNHMHALTIQYFEALEVQQLRTRVVDAHRLLFVPQAVIDFTDERQFGKVVDRHRRPLIAAARALGLHGPVAALEAMAPGDSDPERMAARARAVWGRAHAAQVALTHGRNALVAAIAQVTTDNHALLVARDELRAATDPGLAQRDDLQRAIRRAAATLRRSAADVVRLREAHDRLRGARDRAGDERQRLEAFLRSVQAITDPPVDEVIPPQSDDVDDDLDGDATAQADPVLAVPDIDIAALDAVEAAVRTELAQHALPLNQALWMRIDPGTWATLLAGHTFRGDRLGTLVDPTPVAVAGTRVAFRWHHATQTEADAFRTTHVDEVEPLLASVALPTGGIFGEAVLGDSNAAEKVDITRFWNWTDSLPPIRPTPIGPLSQPAADEGEGAMPTQGDVQPSHTQLGPISFPQVASGIPNVTDALANPELFRDMGGAAASAALARAAMEHTASGASDAADMATENLKRHLEFQRRVTTAALDHVKEAAAANEGRTVDTTMAGAVVNARDEAAGDDTTGVTESHDLATDVQDEGSPSATAAAATAAAAAAATAAAGRAASGDDADGDTDGDAQGAGNGDDATPAAEFIVDET